ncbi:MAG: hypothetical protein OES09_07145 [Gammaproteobacteria bacterium]|nr:hypothetical protein [Gammaproteobacteria bacterium]
MHLFSRLRRGVLIAGLVTACGTPATATAQEITPFRLTGIEGDVEVRYDYDERTVGERRTEETRETRTSFEQDIFVLAHGYVYHPNLLNLDIGGGPLFVQSELDTNDESNDANDGFFNFLARLRFLEDKPYPFQMFYERLNPSVSIGLVDEFVQTNEKYGLNFFLREPFSPVSLTVEASRSRSEGDGLDLVVDDTIDQAIIRAHKALGPGSFAQLSYQTIRQESRTGSPGLPLRETTISTDTANFDSRFVFGLRRQYRLTNTLTYTTQEEFPSRDDLRLFSDLRWNHSPKLESFYRYTLQDSEQELDEATSQSAVAGLTFWPSETLSGSAEVGAEDQDTTQFDLQRYGTRGSVNYRIPVQWGTLQLGAGMAYNHEDQDATARQANIFGERVVLSGITLAPLANEFVIATSVVVSNVTRTQTFVEGFDYQLVIIGSRTEFRRLAAGNIIDGQTVLVDYAFEVGGTFSFSSFNQSYQANLSLFRYYNLYVRYRDLDQDLRSGVPTVSLNSLENVTYGARADVPVWWDWTVGGEIEIEDQEEDIAPFERHSYSGYVQLPLPFFLSRLRLTAKRITVDNEGSPEDVDLKRYAALLQSRPWFRATLSAEVASEKDTGGTVERRRDTFQLGAEWRIRQLLLALRVRAVDERQDDFVNERSEVRATIRRDF